MAVYKSRGIVLRSIRYGEADRITDIYTLDRGLISAIVKGVRRVGSRFGARMEPLSCVEFVAYEGRTLDTVTQAEVLRSFRRVREDLRRLEAAGGMVRAVRAFCGGDEADRRVFNLLFRGLEALEGRTGEYAAVEVAFVMKLSALAGYAPELGRCVSCRRGFAEGLPGVRFAPEAGGMLCSECQTVPGGAFPVPPGLREALMGLMRRPVAEARLEFGLIESARRVVQEHALAHAPAGTVAQRMTG
ncbi:DNA repair protein RecO [Rubrobacter taiwanensis]|jgi:DNA repair protein RecO (recombination protein O)|nr:DNA repair protein RecO [Rubrobacter taiwanensis]